DLSSSFIDNNLFGIGTTWHPWATVSQGGAGAGTSITPVPVGNGNFVVFAVNPSGFVFTASGSAQTTWTGWGLVGDTNHHVGAQRSVTALANGDGRYVVFMADTNGEVFSTIGSGANWPHGWQTVNQGRSGTGTSIAAVRTDDGRYALYVTDIDGSVY